MKSSIHRRAFLSKGAMACAACCLLSGSKLNAITKTLNSDEKINPRDLNYCGYRCPDHCAFLKGSLENNVDLKKKAYTDWHIKERFGMEFNADELYCFGCKNSEKPEGIVLKNCTVRSCAIEKKIESCIECDELVACDKELWERFPDFKKMVIEMQQKYRATV
jgi:hypothetical protein